MSGSAALLTRSWRVGARTVTMTVPQPGGSGPQCVAVEWVPDTPLRLSAAEFRDYRAGRDALLAAVAQQLAAPVALIEL